MRGRVSWLLVACLLCGCMSCVEPVGRPLPSESTRSQASVARQGAVLTALDEATCRARLRDDATPDSLLQAAERNLAYLAQLPLQHRLTLLNREISVSQLLAATQALLESKGTQLEQLCDRLRLYEVTSGDTLWVAGYYQPEVRASRRRTERFRYPIYRTPDDLVDVHLKDFCPECPARVVQGRVKDGKLIPYFTRTEIELGALSGRGYELAWLDDPVEAYFLHVQGSALLELEDGVRLQVSYAASNGHPYRSIAKVLSERGKISGNTLTLGRLKEYLRTHPEEQAELFAQNPRWVFFRGVAAGPVGSCGVPLTAGRSVAADPAFYAHGALAFIEILPRNNDVPRGGSTVRRFVFFQDAGSTTGGANRLDVFWGSGAVAEAIAADLENPGRVYFLLPKE